MDSINGPDGQPSVGGRTSAGGPLPGDETRFAPDSSTAASVPASVPELDLGFASFPEDDFDPDASIAWTVAEIEAGRQQIPSETDLEGPAISISLGDACDIDPALLVAMCGPDGLGGQAVSAAFGQHQAVDALRPGPVLAALTAQAVSAQAVSAQAVSGPGGLTDDELTGALQAARRLANLADYQQTVVIAEFGRRRQAQFEAARAAGKPVGCRDGEFPGEELAIELVETGAYAGTRIDTALELTTRLPRTLAGMADGMIDLGRAMTIAAYTVSLTDADAAYADEVLADVAASKRPDQLARKAAALEMKLAPGVVRARKELARQLDQRVETRREASGNASLAGRELDTADVIAAKAHIDAIADRLRDSGLVEGTLGRLRALALIDLTQGRDPLDRIKPALRPAPGAPVPAPGTGGRPERAPDETPDVQTDGPVANRGRGPAPVPAVINLLVPAGTLLGWGTAPAQAAGWGLLDAGEARALAQAAAEHPRTRWCMTITAPDGTALAHGCAAGQHPWPGSPWPGSPGPGNSPPPGNGPSPGGSSPPGTAPGPDPGPGDGSGEGPSPPQAAQLLELLRRLDITLEPVARDTCAHSHAEDRYVPSRKLRHLLRARNQTCTAPACNAQAVYCDIDHTVPYPDGPTCECNTNPKCRRHHRTKQAPGWKAAQPSPDTVAWTTPAGRTHTSTATSYHL